ncbi:hypothetical protein [Viridibacillus arvi]|uniref:hypothetical protein n=1 Tax=Viridibacillus arvi TaxID=263475 RepID=UPI003D092014
MNYRYSGKNWRYSGRLALLGEGLSLLGKIIAARREIVATQGWIIATQSKIIHTHHTQQPEITYNKYQHPIYSQKNHSYQSIKMPCEKYSSHGINLFNMDFIIF